MERPHLLRRAVEIVRTGRWSRPALTNAAFALGFQPRAASACDRVARVGIVERLAPGDLLHQERGWHRGVVLWLAMGVPPSAQR